MKIYAKNGDLLLDVLTTDNCERKHTLQGDNYVSVVFASSQGVIIPVDSYVQIETEKFSVLVDYQPTEKEGLYDYSIKFYHPSAHLAKYLFYYQAVIGAKEYDFKISATLPTVAGLVLKALNSEIPDVDWSIGDLKVNTELKDLTFSGVSLLDAISYIATQYDTEWWFDGSTLNFIKCEIGEEIEIDAVTMLSASSQQEKKDIPPSRVYAYGGTKNMPASSDINVSYSNRLHLPDGVDYVNIAGITTGASTIKFFDDIYPKIEGVITHVVYNGDDKNPIYYVNDAARGFDLAEQTIPGTIPRIRFISGRLNGREFDVQDTVKQEGDAPKGYMEVFREEQEGVFLPRPSLDPRVGDKYMLYNILLPDSKRIEASLRLLAATQDWADTQANTVAPVNCDSNRVYFANNNLNLKIGSRIKLLRSDFKDGYLSSRITDISYPLTEPGNIKFTLAQTASGGKLQSIEKSIKTINSILGNNELLYHPLKGSPLLPLSASEVSIVSKALFGAFTEGVFGSGAAIIVNPETGKSRFEVDEIFVRMKAVFTEFVVDKLSHIGGELVMSRARMQCIRVEDKGTVYRCYFEGDQQFVAGDQARAQVFTGDGAKFYWRLVTNIGVDYVDLSKEDAANASSAPSVGDTIVQFGNRTDVTRQSLQVLSSYGDDSPSYKQYSGINSFSLEDKDLTVLSRTKNKIKGEIIFESGKNAEIEIAAADKKAQDAADAAKLADSKAVAASDRLNNWASDATISPTEKLALKQEAVTLAAEKESIISDATKYGVSTTAYLSAYTAYLVELNYHSTATPENIAIRPAFATSQTAYYIQQKAILNLIVTAAKKIADGAAQMATESKNYLDNVLPKDLAGLQSQIDGQLESYFLSYDPSLTNLPASEWTTTALKEKHLNDTFTNNTSGRSWRWTKNGTAYTWTEIADTATVEALRIAGLAKDTADGKRRVFVAQPVTPYDIGDLWSQGLTGDIMACKTSRFTGAYSAADWQRASKYTDDTAAKAAKSAADEAAAAAAAAKTAADKGISDASKANKSISDISNDNIVTPSEKPTVLKEWEIIKSEYPLISAQAVIFGVSALSYTAAYTSLLGVIGTNLDNLATNWDVSGASLRGAFKNYYGERTKLQGLFVTGTKNTADEAKAKTDNFTNITGGLIVSSMLTLGETIDGTFKIQAGMTGIGSNPLDILAWYGGERKEIGDNHAQIVFRRDGSGYLANNNLWWDAKGNISSSFNTIFLGDTDIKKFLNEVKFDIEKVDKKVDDMFTLQTINGVKVIRMNYSAYTDYGLTCLGYDPITGGGGSNYNRLDTWESYTDDKAGYVLSAGLGWGLRNRIIALENGAITAVDWGIITGKPTTLSGYGIIDGVLSNDPRLTNARPASDVYGWAKSSNKPSYAFNEIGDSYESTVPVNSITRRVITSNVKEAVGFISRACIGLFNNVGARFSDVLISAGIDDAGTTFRNWRFSSSDGLIYNHDNIKFLLDTDIPSWAKTPSKPNYLYQELTGNVVANSIVKVGSGANEVLKADGGTVIYTPSSDANTLVQRNTNGEIFANHINTYIGQEPLASISSVYVEYNNDKFIRKVTVNGFKSLLGDIHASTASNINNSGTVILASSSENNLIKVRDFPLGHTLNSPVKMLDFGWYGEPWSIGNIRGDGVYSLGLGVYFKDALRVKFTDTLGLYDAPRDSPYAILKDIPTSLPANGGHSNTSNTALSLDVSGTTTFFKWEGYASSPTWIWGVMSKGESKLYNPEHFNVLSSTYTNIIDTRNIDPIPEARRAKSLVSYFTSINVPSANWTSILSLKGWDTDYSVWEIAGPAAQTNGDTGLHYRAGARDTWLPWTRILTADIINNYSVPSRNWTNWNDNTVIGNVVGQLGWAKHGSNHTIFDASAGVTPNGIICDNNSPVNRWISTYPVLMGFNGSVTYGVRVDSSRLSDSTARLATARLLWGQSFDAGNNVSGSLTGVTSITASGGITAASITCTTGRSSMSGGLSVNISNINYGISVNSLLSEAGMHTRGGKCWTDLDFGGGLYMPNATWIAMTADKQLLVSSVTETNGVDSASILAYGGIHSKKSITAEGGLTCLSDASDRRLKEDIRDFNAKSVIESLQPKMYKWNSVAKRRGDVFNTDRYQFGLIYQDVMENPYICECALHNKFGDGYGSVKLEKVIPVLIQGEKELYSEVDLLKQEVDALKKRIKQLEGC